MPRKISSASFAAVIALCYLPVFTESVLGQDLSNVEVQNYDDFHIGWDSGRLEIEVPGKKLGSITLKFSSKERRQITLLKLVSGRWSVDMTSLVTALPRPFPTRISVIIHAWSGDGATSSISVSLPFEASSELRGESDCEAMEFLIKDGKIAQHEIVRTPPERCVY
jgi:hypothetical protein